jgi:hypothetical protein
MEVKRTLQLARKIHGCEKDSCDDFDSKMIETNVNGDMDSLQRRLVRDLQGCPAGDRPANGTVKREITAGEDVLTAVINCYYGNFECCGIEKASKNQAALREDSCPQKLMRSWLRTFMHINKDRKSVV